MYHLSLLLLFQNSFEFQPNVCDDCHDMTQRSLTFVGDRAIAIVKRHDYRINFWFMINNQAVDRYKILICLKRLNNYEKIKKIIVVIESNTQCNMKEQQKLSTFLCLIKKYFFLAMILEMIEQFLKFSSDEIKKKFHSPKFSMSLAMAKTKKHAQQ